MPVPMNSWSWRQTTALRAIYGIASYPSALPTMRMPTALPVRSGAIWEVPCPIWQNRISRYLWICLPATSGN